MLGFFFLQITQWAMLHTSTASVTLLAKLLNHLPFNRSAAMFM